MQIVTKLTILGGGIAGLSAEYFSKKKGIDFAVYEAGETVGGNCRTIQFGEFKIDTGAHRFHDKDDEMTAEMRSFMKDKVHEVNVPSYIFHRGRLIHFPLTPTNVFYNLYFSEVCKAAWYFFVDKFRFRTINNFETLVYQKYGRYIPDLFLTNYSEKLWGVKCADLSTEVAGNRLKNLNQNSIIFEFSFRKKRSKHLEGAFYYPLQEFGNIARKMEIFCGEGDFLKDLYFTFTNNRYLAHSVRELITFPITYFPLFFLVYYDFTNIRIPKNMFAENKIRKLVWISFGIFLLLLGYQVVLPLKEGIGNLSQKPEFTKGESLPLQYLITSHYFEHFLDTIFLVLFSGVLFQISTKKSNQHE